MKILTFILLCIFFSSCTPEVQHKTPATFAEAIEKGRVERENLEVKRRASIDSLVIKEKPRNVYEIERAIESHNLRLDFSKVSINRILCESGVGLKNPINLKLSISPGGSLTSCTETKNSNNGGPAVSNTCAELKNVYYGSKIADTEESANIELYCVVYAVK